MASLRSGVWVNGLFWWSAGSCSERPPSRQFHESLASEAFWVSRILLPELGPSHGYYSGQRSPLVFPDLLLLQCEAPGWGGGARKSHRYLGGSGLGLGTGDQAGPPHRGKQSPAGSDVGAPAKPAPRSPKEEPAKPEENFRFLGETLDTALLALGGVVLASLWLGVWVGGFLAFSGVLV